MFIEISENKTVSWSSHMVSQIMYELENIFSYQWFQKPSHMVSHNLNPKF